MSNKAWTTPSLVFFRGLIQIFRRPSPTFWCGCPFPSPLSARVEHVDLTMTVFFPRQELDPPEAVDLETTAKIKVPSQITQPDINNDQTTVGILMIGHSGLSLSQANSGIQNSSSCDWRLSLWY